MTAAVASASRSSSVSPTQTIGHEPAAERGAQPLVHGLVGLAEELAALGVADDHVRAARLGSMATEISPVNAPFGSQWTFCAAEADGAAGDRLARPARAR